MRHVYNLYNKVRFEIKIKLVNIEKLYYCELKSHVFAT